MINSVNHLSECGVTANIPVLGTGDSGFESRHSDTIDSMPAKRFQKKKEDFICENCNREVKGNGYTNHCQFCLWSKHVDINPGDREAVCKGLMKPIKLEKEKSEYIITQECAICGYTKRNKLSPQDNFDVALSAVKANTTNTNS